MEIRFSALVFLLYLCIPSPANAWKGNVTCGWGYMYAGGSAISFQVVASDFTSAEQAAIAEGAAAWDASAGRYPGTTWRAFISSTPASAVDLKNTTNELGLVDFTDGALKDIGVPKSARKTISAPGSRALAWAINDFKCSETSVRSTDIIIDMDRTLLTSTIVDGDTFGPLDVTFLATTVAHEIGHAIGFGHHPPDINLMDGYGVKNATFPDVPALDEDNVRGLQAAKPTPCTPVANVESCMRVAVSPWFTPESMRHRFDIGGLPNVMWIPFEGWETLGTPDGISPGSLDLTYFGGDLDFDQTFVTGGYGVPRFVNLGDRTTDWFEVKFYFVPNAAVGTFDPPFAASCEDYSGFEMWSHRRMRLGQGKSYHRMPVVPNSFIAGLSSGSYRVCVHADTDGDLDGDPVDDNVWVLDRIFVLQ